jgi:hypothetical protein
MISPKEKKILKRIKKLISFITKSLRYKKKKYCSAFKSIKAWNE